MSQPAYQRIAQLIDAAHNCARLGNPEWEVKHRERIREIAREIFPSGSGLDNGPARIDLGRSKGGDGFVIAGVDFHHMDEHGSYDGWTEHEIHVKPDLAHGFTLRITGRDRDGIKEYLGDTFHHALTKEVS